MESIEQQIEYIEWESFPTDFEFAELIPNDYIPKNAKIKNIYRDDTHNLKCLIEINNYEPKKHFREDFIAGIPLEKFNIKGTNYNGSQKFELKYCYISEFEKPIYETNSNTETTLTILFYELIIENKADENTKWLTEWYLNAPQLYLPHLTEKEISLHYSRKRDILRETIQNFEVKNIKFSGRDFALVDTDDIKFLLTNVISSFKPEWSHKMGIEYRNDLHLIPKKELRKSVSEIVSFILGKQLVNIGYSEYKENGELIKQCFRSPSIGNLMAKCNEPAMPPINTEFSKMHSIESTLTELVPAYLKLKDATGIDKSLYLYWESLNSALGPNLPILSSALEMIMNKWFKSNKSKTNGTYMEKKDFEELVGGEIKLINGKLHDKRFGSRIINRINNCRQMSVHDQFENFFDEIDLKVGSIENKAIKSRHGSAHGDFVDNPKKAKKLIENTYAYNTLYHRVILKMLGYEGYYIDMSTPSFPQRLINIPLGEVRK